MKLDTLGSVFSFALTRYLLVLIAMYTALMEVVEDMQLKHSLIPYSFLVFTYFCLVSDIWAKETVVLGFSSTADGSPVSIYDGRNLTGFCGEVASFLKENYNIQLHEIKQVNQRFSIFAETLNKKTGVQCGPTSSTFNRQADLKNSCYEFAFTDVFFSTETKILVRKTHTSALYSGNPIQIGILSPPTFEPLKKCKGNKQIAPKLTTQSVSSLFPHAELVNVEDRKTIVEQLLNGTLHAYASDALILEDIFLKNLGNQKYNFSIEPPLNSFLKEDYVLVIYNPDNKIVDLLNNWFKSEPGLKARQALEQAREGDYLTQNLADWLVWLNRGDHLEFARKIGVLALISISLLIIGFVFFGFSWVKRSQSAPNSFISNQAEIITIPRQKLRDYSKKLHDDISQHITAIIRLVENDQSLISNQENSSKEDTIQTLQKLIAKVRDLSHSIDNELNDEIDRIIEQFKKDTGIDTERKGNIRWQEVEKEQQNQLRFILEEALINIKKHAQAKQVFINFEKTSNLLILTVRDDGHGIVKKTDSSQKRGIGLKTMENRAEHDLKGKFTFTSSKNGSTVQVRVPFKPSNLVE